ncbi:MAG: hypothetical protein M3340_18120, partial [Actinomycetota bacterium]|nr:hypothetical protein [Actinomycetota bacterium]
PGSPLSGRLTGDGPTTLALAGRFGTVRAELDGQPVAVERARGALMLTLPLAGEHELVLRPAG